METQRKRDTRELMIYVFITYGLTYLVGFIFLFDRAKDTNMQIYLSTMFPAMGAAIAMHDRGGNKKNTRYLNDIIFVYFGINVLVFILMMAGFFKNVGADNIMLVPTILASMGVFFYTWISCPRLSPSRNFKMASLPIALALLLELVKNIAVSWENFSFIATFFAIVSIFPAIFLSSIAYLGEEYGWRGFLQEKLQTKFGLCKGVIILGVLWELWHIPFYPGWFGSYTPSQLAAVVLVRITSVVSMAIFIGWAYLRTNNIWVCIIIHMIHNSMAGVSRGEMNPRTVILMVLFGLLPALAIFTKEFKKKPELPGGYKNTACGE
ncbi:CPBP family intramembrane glutamic endopeptidase [Faecalicatena orotica]|uniref:CPBP family intramembrane glutamic endopeptidase n=1 Tax=Faecalicatena orotica TaxID=1544 RepID=UPI003216ADF9